MAQPPPPPPPRPIVHINGYPGIGKLTIARKLVDLLAPHNGKLVHNHLLIDPAGAVLPRTSPDYQPLRRAIRAAVFDTLVKSRDAADSVYVFTDSQSSDGVGSAVMDEFIDMARRRGCAFVPVILTCDQDENLRRLASAERAAHGKLTDPQLVAHIRQSEDIYQPADSQLCLQLDITGLDVDAAAEIIYKHVLDVCPQLETGNLKVSN